MQNDSCHTAIAQIEAYLEHPERPVPDLDASLEHVRTCASCMRRLRFLAAALTLTEEDSLTCDECEKQLPFFAAAVEPAASSGWRPLLIHLATCPHCAAMYADLQDLEALANASQPDAPFAYPSPDLSFLRPLAPVAPARQPSHQDRLGRLIVVFSADLLRMLQPLPLASAVVKAQPEAGMRSQVRVPASQSDLQATITIERPSANSAMCNLIVAVHIAGRDWPQLAGIGVTLRRGEQVLSVDETDAFGEIIFRQVPVADLPSLEVIIAPNG